MTRYLVTIGTFDGVHRGHQKLMRWVISKARGLGLRTRVVLFESPPRFYFHPHERLPLLTTSAQRSRLLKELGIDRVEILRFGPRWANMPHTRFFEDYLIRRWKAGGVLVGRDFAFGKGRKGNLAYLGAECARRSMHLGVLPLLRVNGRKISSSAIRDLLKRGEVARVAALLGRPHEISGRVVRGQGLGRRIGVPTANVSISPRQLAPRGVYEACVSGPALRERKAVCNVGTRPTVSSGRKITLEVHIPGFSGSLYGKTITVRFLRRIRAERRFKSLELLKRRIQLDIRGLEGLTTNQKQRRPRK